MEHRHDQVSTPLAIARISPNDRRIEGPLYAHGLGPLILPETYSIARAAVALDWDGALRRGFLIVDWARHLLDYGEIDPSHVQQMEFELDKYHSGLINYSPSGEYSDGDASAGRRHPL